MRDRVELRTAAAAFGGGEAPGRALRLYAARRKSSSSCEMAWSADQCSGRVCCRGWLPVAAAQTRARDKAAPGHSQGGTAVGRGSIWNINSPCFTSWPSLPGPLAALAAGACAQLDRADGAGCGPCIRPIAAPASRITATRPPGRLPAAAGLFRYCGRPPSGITAE